MTDAKDTVLDAAAQAIGDGPKDAILGAFDAFTDATGKIALTEDGSLQGNRIIGEDNYTGRIRLIIITILIRKSSLAERPWNVKAGTL